MCELRFEITYSRIEPAVEPGINPAVCARHHIIPYRYANFYGVMFGLFNRLNMIGDRGKLDAAQVVGSTRDQLNAFSGRIRIYSHVDQKKAPYLVDEIPGDFFDKECKCSCYYKVVCDQANDPNVTNFMRFIVWNKRILFWGVHPQLRTGDPGSSVEPIKPISFKLEAWNKVVGFYNQIPAFVDVESGVSRKNTVQLSARKARNLFSEFFSFVSADKKLDVIHRTLLSDWVALAGNRCLDIVFQDGLPAQSVASNQWLVSSFKLRDPKDICSVDHFACLHRGLPPLLKAVVIPGKAVVSERDDFVSCYSQARLV
ncbi:hypothetical protein ACEPT0_16690 [Pseudomonas paraeruginosa]|uniref:hypothetical protein n=1 Tax=Pseudomonas paraeruginosa TaxID=2994495 RepID=UPI003749F28C